MSNPPNPDRLYGRVETLVAANDPERARELLAQYLDQFQLDDRFSLLLGDLERSIGESERAGRWYWVAGSKRSEHKECVAAFLRSRRNSDPSLSLPRGMRTDETATEGSQRASKARKKWDRISNALLLALLAASVIGLVRLVVLQLA